MSFLCDIYSPIGKIFFPNWGIFFFQLGRFYIVEKNSPLRRKLFFSAEEKIFLCGAVKSSPYSSLIWLAEKSQETKNKKQKSLRRIGGLICML